jgi:high-affinity Fe2+/Pb2+ permease
MLSFFLFIVILVFLTIYACHASQVRRMALAGKKVISHIPKFLVIKLSDMAYMGVSLGFAWVLIIVGGLIANSNSDPIVKEYPGIGWAAVYFVILILAYVFFWLKNRSVDLKK